MIENIDLIRVDSSIIESLKSKFNYDILLSMACNYKLINNNLDFLESVGITNIENLLLNREGIFFTDTDELKNKFNSINTKQFVQLINEDYTSIDEIFN